MAASVSTRRALTGVAERWEKKSLVALDGAQLTREALGGIHRNGSQAAVRAPRLRSSQIAASSENRLLRRSVGTRRQEHGGCDTCHQRHVPPFLRVEPPE